MKLQFLGTAAAEGVPSVFCRCATCEAARRHKGKDIRRRASVLINDELLIDMGPDLFNVGYENGISLGDIKWTLQTHPHDDHLDAGSFFSRNEGTLVSGLQPMIWYTNQSGVDRMDVLTGSKPGTFLSEENQRRHAMTISLIEPWEAFSFGHYNVQSVAANHDDRAKAMLFAIEDTTSGGRVFYGTDTGPLPDNTWERLAALGWSFDVFVLDHTIGTGPRNQRHLNAEQFLEEVAHARSLRLLSDRTRVIAHHFAHHSNPPHDEFVAIAAKSGYEPAWDGLVVDVLPQDRNDSA